MGSMQSPPQVNTGAGYRRIIVSIFYDSNEQKHFSLYMYTYNLLKAILIKYNIGMTSYLRMIKFKWRKIAIYVWAVV